MIPMAFIVPGIALAALVPTYVALYLASWLKRLDLRYLAAGALGLTFWFFFDTMGDAASLEESYGVYPPYLFGGLSHFALLGAFVAGVAVLAAFDHYAVRGPSEGKKTGALFLIPLAVALVMGVHSLGEGWEAVSPVSSGPPVSAVGLQALIDAFGTLPAVISYPLHKFCEASIVGVLYAAYVSRMGGGRWWQIPLLGLLFAGPAVVGATAGYLVSFDTTYLFAFGVTSAFYAAMRLVGPMNPGFKAGPDAPRPLGWGIFLAFAVGFFLLYFAALLH